MPDVARIESLLAVLGYGPDLVVPNYEVWVEVERALTVDLAVLGDAAVKDLSTSTAVCGSFNGDGDVRMRLLADAAEALAAPAVIVHRHRTVSWFTSTNLTEPWVTFDDGDLAAAEKYRPVL